MYKNNLLGVWQDYLGLCKIRVVVLMLLTAAAGMYLATSPDYALTGKLLILANLGIGLCACSAAVVNHLVDRRIDTIMSRTRSRPLVQGKVTPKQAVIFSIVLGLSGLTILSVWVNVLTAALTFLSLIGYAGIYTGYLKRATPQNIVIGGLAGAAPPLLGWTSVTGHFVPESLLLVLIIFVWTPPHFWALAVARYEDYAKANIPMLPVTHGIALTKLYILLYTILLIVMTILPYAVGMSGIMYLAAALLLGGRFLYWAVRMKYSDENEIAMKTFRFSIIYLAGLFGMLLIDHYWGMAYG